MLNDAHIDAIADIVARHTAELNRARAETTSAAVPPREQPAAQPVTPDDRRRARLLADAELSGRPPRILLPAQYAAASPHRRPTPMA